MSSNPNDNNEADAPTEKKRWEELLKIKSMAINIEQKRKLKAQLVVG